jgi:hypothetical protein
LVRHRPVPPVILAHWLRRAARAADRIEISKAMACRLAELLEQLAERQAAA